LKLSVDIEKIKHSQSIDDAMILGVIMANKKTEILPGLSPESLQTITELSKQFETMRTMHLQGTLTMSVLVNETEFQWSRIVGGIG
jgi:hypothetical protein